MFKKFKVLAAAAAFCLSQAAGAVEVAPYVQSWSPDTLTASKQNAGLNSATLAFGITRGTCVLDQNLLDRLPDARKFVAAGGRLIVSMGGADGVYAEIACTDDQLFALMEKLMVDSATRRFDWDVEGNQLTNTTGTDRRNRVLARLQAKYPDLYTSFTLPGWLYGVSSDSMNLLKSAIAAGVRISMVNVMTMSFGVENLKTMVSPSTVAQASIDTFRAVEKQLAPLFPGKTAAQIRAMMGMTPMIGTNDDLSTFTLADAQTIADFAKLNGIGLLSYWSFQRDVAQSSSGWTPIGYYSGVAQSNYQFLSIFKTAAGEVLTAPTTTEPAPEPAPSTTCGTYSNWARNATYAAGAIVSYNGKLYIAKSTNRRQNPSTSTAYWSPYSCTDTAVAPAPEPAPSACITPTVWVQGQYYPAGSVVSYQWNLYIAKYANPGYNPTISTYYWAPYSC